DPRAFRAEGEFEDDLDQVIDVLHNAKRVDANQPVLVAGDPERVNKKERLEQGVPIPDDLMEQLRAVAKNANVAFILAGACGGGWDGGAEGVARPRGTLPHAPLGLGSIWAHYVRLPLGGNGSR